MKRRSMIKNAALLAGGAVLTGCDTNKQTAQSLNNLFVHHVLFWLKEPNNPQACAEFEAGLYQPHPQHQEFIKNCEHLWNRVMVIDSEAAI